MDETFVVFLALYLAPAAAFAAGWTKPLGRALGRILLVELAAVVLCFPVYALVDMLSWDWLNWGSLSLSDLVTYWQAGGGPVALWSWMGLGETALILAVRWVVDRVRRRMRQAEFEAVTQPRQ